MRDLPLRIKRIFWLISIGCILQVIAIRKFLKPFGGCQHPRTNVDSTLPCLWKDCHRSGTGSDMGLVMSFETPKAQKFDLSVFSCSSCPAVANMFFSSDSLKVSNMSNSMWIWMNLVEGKGYLTLLSSAIWGLHHVSSVCQMAPRPKLLSCPLLQLAAW